MNIFLIQRITIYYNCQFTYMKRNIQTVDIEKLSNGSSEVDMDCSCEILNDTSLSNIGDSQCDCSDCLEANLDAFNEFKNQDVKTSTSAKQNLPNNGAKGSKGTKSINKLSKQTVPKLQRYQSTEHLKNNKSRSTRKWNKESIQKEQQFQQKQFINNQQINDFLLVTRNRTRKYLEQRKKLQENKKKEKDDLKEKIKKNLQILKYTAEMERQNIDINGEIKHQFAWNHSKYRCQCNGKKNLAEFKENCCRKIKQKSALDTNMEKIQEDFQEKRDQIIQERKRRRNQQRQRLDNQKCKDHCPNHHMRTNKQKLKKIQKFILKNVKKYELDRKKKRQEKEQKQKALEAKLKAIDIKSKQKLLVSKKHDQSSSRTTFRLSIDNFDTFSQLRDQNQRRKAIKQNQREVKRKMKEGGGQLLQKVYEVDEDWGDFDPRQKKPEVKFTTKSEVPELRKENQVYERVAYDAQLKIPKQLRKGEKKQIPQKDKRDLNSNNQAMKSRKNNLSKTKQQQEKKRIEAEINKKKKQILEQFQKRNSNKPSNAQIRKEYQEKIGQGNTQKQSKLIQQSGQRQQYRANYQIKAGKNTQQIQVHGDPLLQQYQYHKDKEKAKTAKGRDNMQIFQQNIHSLTGKQKLKC